jgi:MinD-like ATPase involved in chromosome partitioning or flagellar assembly
VSSPQPHDDGLSYAQGILRATHGQVSDLHDLPELAEIADVPGDTFVAPQAASGLSGLLNRWLCAGLPVRGKALRLARDDHDRFIAQLDALQVPQPQGRTGVLSISASGGDGKTTLSTVLALMTALHRLNESVFIVDTNSNRGLAGARAGYDGNDGLNLVEYCQLVRMGRMTEWAQLSSAIGLPMNLEFNERHRVGVIRSEPKGNMILQSDFTAGIELLYARMGISSIFFDGPTDPQYSLVREIMEHFITQLIYVTEPSETGLLMAMECYQRFSEHGNERTLPTESKNRIGYLVTHPMVVVNRYDHADPAHRVWIAQIAKMFPGATYGVPEDVALAGDIPIRIGHLNPLTQACLLDIAAAVYRGSAQHYVSLHGATAMESGLTGLTVPYLTQHLEAPTTFSPPAAPVPSPAALVVTDLEDSHDPAGLDRLPDPERPGAVDNPDAAPLAAEPPGPPEPAIPLVTLPAAEITANGSHRPGANGGSLETLPYDV